MAQILPIQTYQQQQAQMQQQAQFQQAPQQGTNDPLFEALVKYITSGPKPQSATATQIQQIMDDHVAMPGGRAYLEELVLPSDPIHDHRIYEHQSFATGWISTNLTSLTINFDARDAYVRFKGTAQGLFNMSVSEFDMAELLYDGSFSPDQSCVIEVKMIPEHHEMIVAFSDEVSIPEKKQPFAQLNIYGVGYKLPPVVRGTGTFQPYFRTQ